MNVGYDLEVAKRLAAEGIAVRAGIHCAQPILARLGLQSTVRPSFAFYSTRDEVGAGADAAQRGVISCTKYEPWSELTRFNCKK